ncbi:hypothetical protein VAR608DRAFT_4872 [Variovorax sp. HW608]|uniref:hypothetical protein n=1 Tax=Variovorax sp. HW608 TaxID=1034889 RepID=UPI0008200EB4|nr:hypothetical protein [Variovorax sp. HW608]SCK49021.1 hypothetical protein VAR608DRAFT_4872 [Variovorax sp. HW608]
MTTERDKGGVVFRSQRVGDFVVHELSMRLHLQVMKDYPEPGIERAAGYLGHAVSNGTGEPIGRDAVLDLPPALFNELMEAYTEVSKRYETQPEGKQPEGSAEGNA